MSHGSVHHGSNRDYRDGGLNNLANPASLTACHDARFCAIGWLLHATGSASTPARAAEFSEPFQADLPCPVLVQKIICFTSDPNHRLISCRPAPNEGRFAIVTDVGRDAVDADALLTNSA
jgi:hypothetical protein